MVPTLREVMGPVNWSESSACIGPRSEYLNTSAPYQQDIEICLSTSPTSIDAAHPQDARSDIESLESVGGSSTCRNVLTSICEMQDRDIAGTRILKLHFRAVQESIMQ